MNRIAEILTSTERAFQRERALIKIEIGWEFSEIDYPAALTIIAPSGQTGFGVEEVGNGSDRGH
jgi:hypothetical protein